MGVQDTGTTVASFGRHVTLIALTLATPSLAAAQAGAPAVTMRIYDNVGLSAGTTADLRAATESLLSRTGIGVRWQFCASAGVVRHPACDEVPARLDVVVRIVHRHETGAARHCGFAMPTPGARGFISLARDCAVRTLAALERNLRRRDVVTEAEILGYTLAHELAHVLLPDVGHSAEGVFRARLERRHWRMVRSGRLVFVPRDAARLRAAAVRRLEPPAAGANASTSV